MILNVFIYQVTPFVIICEIMGNLLPFQMLKACGIILMQMKYNLWVFKYNQYLKGLSKQNIHEDIYDIWHVFHLQMTDCQN